jgi:hypothetical protein
MAWEQSVSNAPSFQALFAAPHQARGGRTEHVTNRIVHENIYSAELLLREPYTIPHRLIDTHIDMVEMRVSACVSNESCGLFPRTGVNVGHHNLCRVTTAVFFHGVFFTAQAAPEGLRRAFAPAWARTVATARPIPRPEPVTIATRDLRGGISDMSFLKNAGFVMGDGHRAVLECLRANLVADDATRRRAEERRSLPELSRAARRPRILADASFPRPPSA